MNKLDKVLNATEIISSNLNNIINAFVEFYGEEYRNEVEEKFRNIHIITYQKPSDLLYVFRKVKEELSNKCKESLFNELGITEQENINKVFFGSGRGFADYKYTSVNSLCEFVNQCKLGEDKRKENYINSKYELMKTRVYKGELTFEKFMSFHENGLPENILNSGNKYLIEQFEYYIDFSGYNYEMQRYLKDAMPVINSIYPDLKFDDLKDGIDLSKYPKIEEITNAFSKQLDSFNESISPYGKLEEYIKECEELDRKVEAKCFKEYVEEFKDLISEESYEKLKNSETLDGVYSLDDIYNVFGSSLRTSSNIEYFHSSYDINNPNQAENIKRCRMKYFKSIGIDLGDNYSDYENSPECKSKWPKEELIDKLLDRKKFYNNEKLKQYLESLPDYQQKRKEIDELGLIDKEDEFGAKAYDKSMTYCAPNIRNVNGEIELFSLLCVYTDNFEDYFDKNIIHEFNHLFELNLKEYSEEEYTITTGWDVITTNLNGNNNKEDDTKREFELFSEIVNEILAQRIATIMHNNGVYLFNTPEKCYDKGGTGYQMTLFLVNEFIDEFLPEIIESRHNSNFEILFDKVGKENFMALNKLFHEFAEKYKGLSGEGKFHREYKKYLDGVVDAENIDLKNLIDRKDEILNNMRNYRKETL